MPVQERNLATMRHTRNLTIVLVSLVVAATFVVSLSYGLLTMSNWDCEHLVSVSDDYYSEAAVDSQGRVHIAFMGVGDYYGLCHGILEGEHWNLTVVYRSIESWGGVSMVIDSYDRVHLVTCPYSTTTYHREVIYCIWSGEEWTTETIDTKVQSRCAELVLDSKGQAHIFYIDTYDFVHGSIKHATRNATGWTIASIPTDGISPFWLFSALLDKDDRVHLLFSYDQYSGEISLARDVISYGIFDGVALDVVDLPFSPSKASIALKSDGTPLVALLENSTGTPRYSLATRTTENWTVEGIISTNSLVWSGTPGIALVGDRVHLILPGEFADAYTIYYASGNDAGWNISEVDHPKWDNMYGCSMAIDASGHISMFYGKQLDDPAGLYLIHATDKIDFDTKFEPFLSAGVWTSIVAALALATVATVYLTFRWRRREEHSGP